MLSKEMLAGCFLMLTALYSQLLYAETEELVESEPSMLVFGMGLTVVVALALYVALQIRRTIRDHLDKPAK